MTQLRVCTINQERIDIYGVLLMSVFASHKMPTDAFLGTDSASDVNIPNTHLHVFCKELYKFPF